MENQRRCVRETMKKIFLLIVGLIVLGVTGCADNYVITPIQGEDIKLNSEKRIFISKPKDGTSDNIRYLNSGSMVSRIMQAEFSKYCSFVEIGERYQTLSKSVITAREKGYDYLVYLTILEWSDISDKASLKINIVDLHRNSTVCSVVVEGKSGFMTFDGDQPQDMIYEPVNAFVGKMYEHEDE